MVNKHVAVDLRYLKKDYKGGIRTFTDGIIEGLLENKCTVSLIVWQDDIDHWEREYTGCTAIPLDRINFKELLFKFLVLVSWSLKNDSILNTLCEIIYRNDMIFLESADIDGVISTTTYNRLFSKKLRVITCLHDIQEVYLPHNFSFLQRVWRYVLARRTVRRSHKVQVSSKFMRNCLLESLPIEENKLVVIPEGVSIKRLEFAGFKEDFNYLQPQLESDFVFYPAGLWPHKNHDKLLEALSIIKISTGKEIPCVLVGYDNGCKEELMKLIHDYGLEKVKYLGQVSIDELRFLYSQCKVVLAIGSHESSCLPAKEALALGKEVVCMSIEPNIELSLDFDVHICEETAQSISSEILKAYASCGDKKNNLEEFFWENITRAYLAEL